MDSARVTGVLAEEDSTEVASTLSGKLSVLPRSSADYLPMV